MTTSPIPEPGPSPRETTNRYWGPEAALSDDSTNYSATSAPSLASPQQTAELTSRGGNHRWIAALVAAVVIASGLSLYIGHERAVSEYEPLLQSARAENQSMQSSFAMLSDERDDLESDLAELQQHVADEAASASALPDLKGLADTYFTSYTNYSGSADYLEITITDATVTADSLGLLVYLDALGFSPAVLERMSRTRALDGTQSAEGKNCNATWTYHPDDGLQIVFEVRLNG